MYDLAVCYVKGEGIEINLERAFYWYQKAAENGIKEVMIDLAGCYENGEGTEKNLEKAFYWNKKAAENGDEKAIFNLALSYYNGKGIERNLEKAFYWYQKAAENGYDIKAMVNLAMCYENGEGTEKNLEKAYYWYQKAAEYGDERAMSHLIKYYEDGLGTKINLEKAFYWRQKVAESNKASSKNMDQFCIECIEPHMNNILYYQELVKLMKIDDHHWCQQCNARRFQHDFSKWTRGFSEIHKAIWSDGPIYSWNFDKQQWSRQTEYEVVLKIINNSSCLNNKFLDEWKHHYNLMSCAKKGSLRKCLPDIVKCKWQDKLQLLEKIILGLKVIHESNLIHRDFHDGNILMSDDHNEVFIIDLGLCKPIDDLQDDEIYGVLPYMAPEILRKNPYTPASDIYSFAMIMWEFTSGIPPFNHKAHDHDLILDICNGNRPEIIKNTPKCYIDLMEKCWDPNPLNRPTIIILENIISEWNRCINKYFSINIDGNHTFDIPNIDNQLKDNILEFIEANETLVQVQANISIIQSHPQAYYTSRKFTEILIQEESEETQCFDEFII
ncbi:kinase-like domain-containing protein [Rhizophagus clarus]|uniref:Kinase-like domain-containing protein n=1 Tax=Rhizophagus clarus TaxID=94130 RepID=A0A8H3MBA8_9GLOM|nr:kinase-like domain-containing protein [Rhizophagus clarus]